MAKKPAKSESLTIRLDPKTRFMLEFVARLRGQTITTVVERAIEDSANAACLYISGIEQNWKDFWHIEDGVRAIKIASEPELRPTYEEDKILKFTQKYWPFFYLYDNFLNMKIHYMSVLWPNINEYVKIDDELIASDFWKAGDEMNDALVKANVSPPNWRESLGLPPKPPKNINSKNLTALENLEAAAKIYKEQRTITKSSKALGLGLSANKSPKDE